MSLDLMFCSYFILLDYFVRILTKMLTFLFFICGIINCTIAQELLKLNTPDINIVYAPTYDAQSKNMYLVNFVTSGDEPSIFRYNTRNGDFHAANIIGQNSPSVIIPVRKKSKKFHNLYAVGVGHDMFVISWDGISSSAQVVDTLFSLEANDNFSRINFGRTDSKGRLYVGTISLNFCNTSPQSSFYRYIAGEGVVRIFSGVYSTTGIAINEDAQELYHLDVCTLILSAFKWDPATGDICDGRVAFDFKSIGKMPGSFVPVGMDIGSNGLLYISDYRQSIYVIDPRTSSVADILEVGLPGIAGVAFAGVHHPYLYLADGSAIVNVLVPNITDIPFSGSSLYALDGLGVTGRRSTYLEIP